MQPDTFIFRDLIVLLAAVLPIVFFCQKLKLPPVAGFLVAGIALGPSAAGLIEATYAVESLAEIGVILLMFTIGLELSPSRLLDARRLILLGGGLYVASILLTTLGAASLGGIPADKGLFLGFLVALSSTAIVLKSYGDRGEIDSPQGRLTVGILIFQDLCIVPMILSVPLLAGVTGASATSIALATGKTLAILAIIIVGARRLAPAVLNHAVRLQNREVFLMVVVFLCFGTAWLTSYLGLSLALGAFVAGVVLSESEYCHQAVAVVLPLRDTFSGLFFISVGMLLDLSYVTPRLPSLLAAVSALVGLKLVVAVLVLWLMTRSVRIATVAALSLAHVGEFSFVLVKVGREAGLIENSLYQTFLTVSIVSMLVTPLLISIAPAVGARAMSLLGGGKEREDQDEGNANDGMKEHVIVIGYGLNGQNIARVLDKTGIAYSILELNSDMVRRGRKENRPICFGDATSPEILEKEGLSRARVMVVAISDPTATRRVVWQARQINSDVCIIARTRYVREIDGLYGLGANQVIPEEFETSLEIVSRLLREYHVPRNIISLQIDLIRRERYAMMRELRVPAKALDRLQDILAQTTTDTVLIPEGAPSVGRTLGEIDLRLITGVTAIAVVRGGSAMTNPGPDSLIQARDIIVLVGDHASLDQAVRLLTVGA